MLLDLKDLRALLQWLEDNGKELREHYGQISTTTLGTLQRRLVVLQEAGAEQFFSEPALKLAHLMSLDMSGAGVVSVLDARVIIQRPVLYSTFMLWLLSELFEELPEVGDLDKPKLVFFFDEAHLLFKDAPKVLLDKIEQVVRLIRSKGVGIYFVTQNPLDIPETILGQLGNRVQHALRAYTPRDQKAVQVAAETFRPNPKFKTEEAITALEVGEALISVLDASGAPTPVERVLVAPPQSRLGPLTDAERAEQMQRSPVRGLYDIAVDRDSAYEILLRRKQGIVESATSGTPPPLSPAATQQPAPAAGGGMMGGIMSALNAPSGRGRGQTLGESIAKAAMRTATTAVVGGLTRSIVRGLLGGMSKRR